MDNRILKNATILKGKNLEIFNGFLKIQDNKIVEIGKNAPEDRGINLEENIVIPSFINSHTHIADSVIKEVYEGKSQPEVVGENGFKFKGLKKSSREKKINAMNDIFFDMKRTGTLTHIDFRENGIEGINLLKEANKSQVNSVILGRFDEEEDLSKILKDSDGIGFPSLDCLSPDKISEISYEANKKGKFVSFHVSETKEARKKSLKKFGKSEIKRAINYDPTFLVHGTNASEDDLRKLADKDIPLVMCPRANFLLNVGNPPIKKAMDNNVKLFLGTDNAAVNPPNIFRELSFAWAYLRSKSSKIGSEEAKKLIKSVTVNPSEYLDLKHGIIEEGSKASFIIFRKEKNLSDIENLYSYVANRGCSNKVLSVYLN